MHHQSIQSCISTEQLACGLGQEDADGKMSLHDVLVLVSQVGLTLAACGLVHVML